MFIYHRPLSRDKGEMLWDQLASWASLLSTSCGPTNTHSLREPLPSPTPPAVNQPSISSSSPSKLPSDQGYFSTTSLPPNNLYYPLLLPLAQGGSVAAHWRLHYGGVHRGNPPVGAECGHGLGHHQLLQGDRLMQPSHHSLVHCPLLLSISVG